MMGINAMQLSLLLGGSTKDKVTLTQPIRRILRRPLLVLWIGQDVGWGQINDRGGRRSRKRECRHRVNPTKMWAIDNVHRRRLVLPRQHAFVKHGWGQTIVVNVAAVGGLGGAVPVLRDPLPFSRRLERLQIIVLLPFQQTWHRKVGELQCLVFIDCFKLGTILLLFLFLFLFLYVGVW